MTKEQCEQAFMYHAPTDGQPAKYEEIRAAGKTLALRLIELCPPGRNLAVAHTKLQEVVMFANAAIAIGE
jgi:hypothetical protein